VESAFISVPVLGADLYPFLPVRLLARLHYDTRAYVGKSTIPVLIVHSREDDIIPYRHGLALYEAAGGRGTLLTIRGDHNMGFVDTGAHYRDGLSRFLEEILEANGD
jgi:fermentation-respiration switch protein FrsA (DUF1100 family)